MKSAITVVADLVRALVLGGLGAVGMVAAMALACAAAGYGLWRWWLRRR